MVITFTRAPVVRHCDHESAVIIATDASDYESACVLSQSDDEGVLPRVEYKSKKNRPAECNYDIYDTEFMAMIKQLEKWRPECDGAAYPIQFFTHHRNLNYFMTKKLLNRRQP